MFNFNLTYGWHFVAIGMIILSICGIINVSFPSLFPLYGVFFIVGVYFLWKGKITIVMESQKKRESENP